MTRRRLTTAEIWGWPVVLGLLSVVGLSSALLADGVGDVISWIALAIPVLVIARLAAGGLGETTTDSEKAERGRRH